MKVEIYHLYRHFEYSNFVYPIVLDVLKVWGQSLGFDVRVFVCKEGDVNLASDADVVAFSVYTQTAPGVYRLSAKLRAWGKVVILGGPHFRGPNYREALSKCDVVVNTICEDQWKELLHKIASGAIEPGRPQALYINDGQNRFRYPDNFYETFKSQRWYQIPSVPTSIGCPYDCEFCSAYLQGKYILRNTHTIYNEMAHIRGKTVFLCDATFGLKKDFTVELMRVLAPLEKKMLVETTLARLKDQEILDALALGGVKWISVGVETLSVKMSKHGGANLEDSLKKVIDDAHERGMLVQGNFICGLDSDGTDSFDRIYEYYKGSDLDLIIIDLLTPYPNTEQYSRIKGEGRIIDSDWEHYDYRHVVYRPQRMSVDQLIDGFTQLYDAVSGVGFVYDKARQIYSRNGISTHATTMISYNFFSGLDARRKKKALRLNQLEIGEEIRRGVPAH
ncbi:MAG TPA: radical SAM protein [Blastocatellia bacterium]|nr:radical SAM protein [Blastocatellia bacterium]